ncbi:DEAD/DEAH box helicase [Salmonella enterica subsp. enterica]|nr:DEAD/DEAH box helicase [Salmonella enterica subsp. enterica]
MPSRDKGFTPTAIQAAAIPPALDGRDVIWFCADRQSVKRRHIKAGVAPARLFHKNRGRSRILILTPTRELARRLPITLVNCWEHTHSISPRLPAAAYMNHAAEVFSENCDIVVATTGRLLQYIKEENFDRRAVETPILLTKPTGCSITGFAYRHWLSS